MHAVSNPGSGFDLSKRFFCLLFSVVSPWFFLSRCLCNFVLVDIYVRKQSNSPTNFNHILPSCNYFLETMDSSSSTHSSSSTEIIPNHSLTFKTSYRARSLRRKLTPFKITKGRRRCTGIARLRRGRRSFVSRVPKRRRSSNAPDDGWSDTSEPTIGIVPLDHEAVHGSRLDSSTLEIRLLHILPRQSHQGVDPLSSQDGDETVHCIMSRTSLSGSDQTDQPPPEFNALSYVWGNPNDKTNIVINSKPVAVTCNLESALRHLRDWHIEETEGLPIWVDAVCINQDDTEERGKQVEIMGDIYRRASRVFSWLGEGNRDSDMFIPVIRRGLTEQLEDYLSGDHEPTQVSGNTWEPTPEGLRRQLYGFVFIDLCNREYWYRLWILQEIVLARLSPTLLVGTCSLSYDEFSNASRRAHSLVYGTYSYLGWPDNSFLDGELQADAHRENLPYLNQGVRRYSGPTKNLDKIREDLGARGHVHVADVFWRQRLMTKWRASDPHDYVYALRGMLDAEAQSLIPVDYSVDPLYAYHHATVAILSSPSTYASRESYNFSDLVGSLPFCLVTGQNEVPSWVLDFASQKIADHAQGLHFATGWSLKRFKTMISSLSSDKITLILKGIYFDEISTVDEISFQRGGKHFRLLPRLRDLKRCLLKITNNNTPIGNSIPLARLKGTASIEKKIERTFFCLDEGLIKQGDSTLWRDWILELLGSPIGDIDEQRLWAFAAEQLKDQTYDGVKAMPDAYMHNILADLWARLCDHKLFFTKAGFWGLGAGGLTVGDRIVFTFGMTCPFIVRPCNPAIFEHKYTMVGCAEIDELRFEREKLEESIENGDLGTIDIRLV